MTESDTPTDLANDPDFQATTYDPSQPPETEAPEHVVETPEPAPEPVVEPEAEEPEDTDDERDTRVKRAWAEARQAKREMERLRREVERLSGQRTEEPDEQVDRIANERAAAMAYQMSFNTECNKIFDDGIKQFGDKFQHTVEAFKEIDGGLSEGMIRAAMEAGDPAKVIHWLGNNLDEAERISKLDAARMGAAVGKIAAKVNAPKPVSKVAAPIRPLNGSATRGETDPDNMSVDDWMRYEDERMAKRRADRFH